MQLHNQADHQATLGAGGPDLLHLFEDRPAPRREPRMTGLYHFAILVPSRAHLARALRRLVEKETPLQGFADHLVSEAIYLADPEGNGIEIYRDRPREEWPYTNGQLQMASDPLDIPGIMAALADNPLSDNGLDPRTTIGHIHLQVSNLPDTEQFYRQILGLDLVLRYGRAADFYAAGGYHHHIGANTWAGIGAPAPPPGATGLRWFELVLPDASAVMTVSNRLEQYNIPSTPHENGFIVRDPAQNSIIIRANGEKH